MSVTFDRILQSLDGHLMAAVAASRKFTVLERDAGLSAILDDITKINQNIDALKGADYAMLVAIDSFVDATDRMVDADTVLSKRRLQLSGQVRIISGTTAEVLDISNLQIEKTDVIQSDSAVSSKQPEARFDEMMPLLARDFAEKSFDRLMGVAFPAKVLDVDDGVITINRGAGFFNQGDVVQLFGKAREVVDEDTGETIRIKGRSLGRATVSSVEPNYSQAQTDGTFTVPIGAEARKAQ
jgi:hypothetical protein